MRKQENTEDYTLLIAVEFMLANNMRVLMGQQVMTNEDVAKLYEVSPDHLQDRVKRNKGRFPRDFTFRLTRKEQELLQTNYPVVFTEKGILMAGGILNSKRAIKVHIQLIRYFVKLYKASLSNHWLLEAMNTATETKDLDPLLTVLKHMLKDKK